MRAFWLSLVLTFWAEMGDKTQFVALAFATRYRLRDVLLGMGLGSAAVLFLSALVGKFIAGWLPAGWIQAITAVSFFAFGLWTLREEPEEEKVGGQALHPIFLIAATIFLAELGDKTMLATMTLATTYSWVLVWLGATSGMLSSDGVAIYAGKVLGKHIPQKTMKGVAAALYFGFSAWSGWQAMRSFHGGS